MNEAAKAVLEGVRCFLLDMDGTFYLGERLLPGSLDFLEAVAGAGRRGVFLTNNSSKDAAYYRRKLGSMGVPERFQDVLTSGGATARYLQGQGKPAYVLGNKLLKAELKEGGIRLDDGYPGQVIVGYDTELTYASLARCCHLLREGLPFIATHPDVNCPTEDGFEPDCGAILALIQASTGRVPDVIIGKPELPMLEAATAYTGLPKERLAMVGDRLYTDIRFGNRHGFPSILVLTGEASEEELKTSMDRPDLVFTRLSDMIQYL